MTATTKPHPALGLTYKDSITEYQGTVVAVCHYLSGCTHYYLESPELVDGKPVVEWFDDQRLTPVEDGADHSPLADPPRSPGAPPLGLPHP